MEHPLVLFRADASTAMGLGHLMRCRAVAEAVVERGGQVIFVMVDPAPTVTQLLAPIPARLIVLPGPAGSAHDLDGLLGLVNEYRPAVTVLDGYHLSDAYQRAVALAGPLAVLWDAADRVGVPADVIVDASPNADAYAYARVSPTAQLLLGPRHALIRRDIRQAARLPGIPLSQRHQVLVTFGGSDPIGLTIPVVSELVARLPVEVGVSVLVGAAYGRYQDLQELADKLVPRVCVTINPPSVVPLFGAAGLVVTAAGSTIGELVALCLPALSVVVAQNQSAATVGGPYPCLDGRVGEAAAEIATRAAMMWRDLAGRERLAQGLRGVVDGEGALRVADALLSINFKERVQS